MSTVDIINHTVKTRILFDLKLGLTHITKMGHEFFFIMIGQKHAQPNFEKSNYI